MLVKIPGNVQEDSGKCLKRFRGMFEKIPGNVPEDSGECSRRFRGMFKKIPGNVSKDLFIFDLFNVDNNTPFLTFGNKTSFPRRVTTTSNL